MKLAVDLDEVIKPVQQPMTFLSQFLYGFLGLPKLIILPLYLPKHPDQGQAQKKYKQGQTAESPNKFFSQFVLPKIIFSASAKPR